MEKVLISGNEAIARGAYEAGVKVGVGYPGTPSTEILENLCKCKEVKTEWSVNEKVALEVGLGAAYAGARTIVTMKHVGLNVAADPLFTSSYTGIKGGLVIVVADDPDMHSSQNEQDSRHYARASKIPMLEPGDSNEARDFVKLAFELSEKYDTPVFVRAVTRMSHSMSIVQLCERVEKEVGGFDRNPKKYVMIPGYARARHQVVEKRVLQMTKDADKLSINFVDKGSVKKCRIGIIASGIVYNYAREVFPEASILKLGMVNPLPWKLISDFCLSYEEIYVLEELDPFVEDQIKARGYEVFGKDVFPIAGEYSPSMIADRLGKESDRPQMNLSMELPPRPPSLCPGCPHRTVFAAFKEMDLTVTGDIGCYTLGALYPFGAMHTCVDMGASVTVPQGMEMATGGDGKTVAVIGDSTFAHSGITGLLNAAYNKRHTVLVVLDNGTTAMTGMQPNPLSGKTITGEATVALDYAKLGEAVGIKSENIRFADAYKKEEVGAALKDSLASGELSLVIVKGPCVILRRKMKKQQAS